MWALWIETLALAGALRSTRGLVACLERFAAVGTALGAAAFAQEWAAGRALSRDAALAYARAAVPGG